MSELGKTCALLTELPPSSPERTAPSPIFDEPSAGLNVSSVIALVGEVRALHLPVDDLAGGDRVRTQVLLLDLLVDDVRGADLVLAWEWPIDGGRACR